MEGNKCFAKNAEQKIQMGQNIAVNVEKSTAKKNREKGIVLALCVIVAVVLLVYTLGGRSYKKTIDTFVTSQFAVDAQSIVELFPEKVLDKELEETGYSKTELVEETNDSQETSRLHRSISGR